MDFAGGSVIKNLPANAEGPGDTGSSPGSGKSQGGQGGQGNPLQYLCLENPMDRGTCRATVHRVTESDTTKATWHACKAEGSLLHSDGPNETTRVQE